MNILRNLLLLSTPLIVAGCLSNDSPASVDEPAIVTFDITGSVGDGPIVDADMRVTDAGGSVLAQFVSDGSASYLISLTTGSGQLPLQVTATGGTDLVTNLAPDFQLSAALFAANRDAVVNVNPFTRLTVDIAADMNGGITASNYREAERIAVREMNSGLLGLASSGVTTTLIDASNVAEIVRASEALGEVVRRVRDEARTAGMQVNGDDVIAALGSDLVDGVIDGRGGPGASPRVAALTNLIRAQVLVETMRGELFVNGSNAMAALEGAVNQVSPGPAAPTLSQLTATAEMITASEIGLVAAHTVSNNPDAESALVSISGLPNGADVSLASALLPTNVGSLIDESLAAVRGSGSATLELVNRVARDRQTTISTANRTPAIAGNPSRAVRVDSTYSFTPTATDPDGDALGFAVQNLPSWASFDATDGTLSGTPGTADVGNYANIVISVSDGDLESSLPAFSIRVTADNSPPTISGTPASAVVAGSAYSFRPTASDTDNDDLTFTVDNLPSWATFNSGSGRLRGTPQSGDVGVYANISITVSDGAATAVLGPFSIEVQAAALGSATLSWTPPTENEDGTLLTDLAGYKVYWSNGDGASDSVTISNPGASSVVVENLVPGTYEFLATAFNSAGVESVFSNPATKVIQ